MDDVKTKRQKNEEKIRKKERILVTMNLLLLNKLTKEHKRQTVQNIFFVIAFPDEKRVRIFSSSSPKKSITRYVR